MEEENTVTTEEVESSQSVGETTTDTTPPETQASDGKYENVKEALRQERETAKELKRRLAEYEQAKSKTLEVDDEGGYDPEQLVSIITDRATAQINVKQAEENDLKEAIQSYPELSDDEDLARAVRSYRRDYMADKAEYISYSDAAEKIVGKIRKAAQAARDAGKEEVIVSETVQKRASEIVGNPSPDTSEAYELEQLKAQAKDWKNPRKQEAAMLELLKRK